jgi:hypothetical protein
MVRTATTRHVAPIRAAPSDDWISCHFDKTLL